MIESIEIENFKSISRAKVKLAKLNIVAGANGSGKSTLLQTLLLLKQADSSSKQSLHLNGPFVQLGDIQMIHHKWAESENLSIIYNFIDDNNFEISQQITPDLDTETLSLTKTPKKDILGSYDIRYLSANRISPADIFLYSSDRNKRRDIGVNGEFTVAYLSQNFQNQVFLEGLDHPDSGAFGIRGSFEANVNAWMQSISPGVSVDATKLEGMNASKLSYGYESNDSLSGVSSLNVGFGITYVLPVIMLLLSAKKGDILVVENPEAHVHPKGQIQLGRLLALASTLEIQIIVETHSDHIFNGMRLFIKEHRLAAKSYAFYYVERTKNKYGGFYSKFSQVELFKDAKIKKAPVGFFDDWENAILSLI